MKTTIPSITTISSKIAEPLIQALEAMPFSVLITNLAEPGHPIVYANPAFEQKSLFKQSEIFGENFALLLGLGSDQPEYIVLLEAIQQRRQGQATLRTYRKDGELIWSEVTVSPLLEQGEAKHILWMINDITDRKKREEHLIQLATHDALTGLPNRALLKDRLDWAISHAQRNQKLAALLFMDLDRFKTINDTLGHNIGDQLLKYVANRLKNCVREEDTVARLGGDEFVILLSDLPSVEVIEEIAAKILDSLAYPIKLESHEVYTSPSIGVSIYPRDGHDSDSLLKQADLVMYRAKAQGGNRHLYYAPEIDIPDKSRLDMEAKLRAALENENFTLHYQPRQSLVTGKIIGVEALLRWRHPRLGPISPAQIIPILEDTGLIIPVGEWILRTACQQCKSWQVEGECDIHIAVNISAAQFKQADFVDQVEDILQETGLNAHCLELELTETLIMQNAEETIDCLHRLQELGIRLAIDDFGTGYSSLSYLKHFPINYLKIDQSFVSSIMTDTNDRAIVSAIIGLAHTLNLKVIAEGVESFEQLSYLSSRKCDEIQGNYFSLPLSARECRKFLHRHRLAKFQKAGQLHLFP
jgi:diguanylate cyclase (GGDEF)-like protein/PAS domain S-box-containing protein